jgi:23S rRNA (cytosine1962-C5)-methyltransferase
MNKPHRIGSTLAANPCPSVQLSPAAAASIRRGHPWVYRDGLVRPPEWLASGTAVDLLDPAGNFAARGLWDARSPIAARVFQQKPDKPLDEQVLLARIESAAHLRQAWFQDGATTAYRLCNGEGDRIPGLVIDRYDHIAVLRIDGEALHAWLERLLSPLGALLEQLGMRTLVLRLDRAEDGRRKIRTLSGSDPPDRIIVRESGRAMEVNVAYGQKTGAFLDQRENRDRVQKLASDRTRVLNLFSYTGGFSLTAALGGAALVTSVDSAAAAHASAQRTFRSNGVDPSAHVFITADCMTYLEQARMRGERFDLIISDPPSFAPSERLRPRAIAAYRKLHSAIGHVLADGGILCAASCSSHITVDDFMSTLDDATLGCDGLRLLELHGQPKDHPTLPAWPEGRYLKFAVLM